jgi:hypothetical protein
MFSPEMETVDQLLGGAMSLTIVRRVYSDDAAFLRGVLALLSCGDVLLLDSEGIQVPEWRWRELFVEQKALQNLKSLNLNLTAQGARRIG